MKLLNFLIAALLIIIFLSLSLTWAGIITVVILVINYLLRKRVGK